MTRLKESDGQRGTARRSEAMHKSSPLDPVQHKHMGKNNKHGPTNKDRLEATGRREKNALFTNCSGWMAKAKEKGAQEHAAMQRQRQCVTPADHCSPLTVHFIDLTPLTIARGMLISDLFLHSLSLSLSQRPSTWQQLLPAFPFVELSSS